MPKHTDGELLLSPVAADAPFLFAAPSKSDFEYLSSADIPTVALPNMNGGGVNPLPVRNKQVYLLRSKGDKAWVKRCLELFGDYASSIKQIDLGIPTRHMCPLPPGGFTLEQKVNIRSVLTEALDIAEPVELLEGERTTQATVALKAVDDAELFHDRELTAWATVRGNGHAETHRVRSRAFKLWTARRYHEAKDGGTLSSQALTDALNTVEAEAIFSGPELPVHLRVAEVDGALWLDLADASWRAVRIDGDGWGVVEAPGIKFWRSRGMLPLPEPRRGGTLEDLRRFVGVDDDGFVLLASWIVGALAPRGPYPVLSVCGEQGSGKSTTCRVARALVDPSTAPLRRPPRDERDLFIAARNGRVVGYDNLSGVPDWLSDALCTVSTGGGLASRELYSDAEESILYAQQPILANGIAELAHRADLRDRCVSVQCVRNLEAAGAVRDEAALWADFDQAYPFLLGAVLDAVSMALRRVDAVRLERPPRMADFAKWVVAAEPALPWPAGRFLEVYAGARESAAREALEGSVLAKAVTELVEVRDGRWTGTATELLQTLNDRVPESVQHSKAWPTHPNRLSGMLKRLATDLRMVGGLNIDTYRESRNRQRMLILESVCNPSSASVASSAPEAMSSDTKDLRADDMRTIPGRSTVRADDQSSGADDTRTIDVNPSSAPKSNGTSHLQPTDASADDADDQIHALSDSDDEGDDGQCLMF